MPSLYMETTKIPAGRTAQEICTVLVDAGATNINQSYENRKLVGLRWTMRVNGKDVPFSMPARVEPVFHLIQKARSVKFRDRSAEADREQAERVAWRQLLRWVQAQLAMIETGMVEPAEVFMPYLEVVPGRTMFQALQDSRFKLLQAPEKRHA